jgi:uncharacterized protein YndB with AHSA1/START domain
MQKPAIEVDTVVAANAETVWKAMTGERSALFPGTEVETDWKVGHPITVRGDWQGKPFEDHGEIQNVDPGKELRFTHWSGKEGRHRPASYHSVRYRLEPEGNNTRVTLSQFNEGDSPELDARTKAEFERNWTTMLEGLKKSAESMN